MATCSVSPRQRSAAAWASSRREAMAVCSAARRSMSSVRFSRSSFVKVSCALRAAGLATRLVEVGLQQRSGRPRTRRGLGRAARGSSERE